MKTIYKLKTIVLLSFFALNITSCADVTVPQARNVDIPSPIAAKKRQQAVNERPDSVMYLPLGEDVLVPERIVGSKLPSSKVGPYELRGETLAGALQLILSDYDVSIAFESEEGLTRKVTVANLHGSLDKVVERVCSLADLYCSFEDGTIVVKDTQTFTVTLPPLSDVEGGQQYINDVIQGLTAVIGGSGKAPVSDPTTRTLIYSVTQRTAKLAENYFQRLRANTAMIVFETYIWEVSLNSGNSTGIDWDQIKNFGKFNTSIGINGSVGADFTNPISIGLPTTQAIGATPTDLIEFLSQFGAVKTISQPQITVLSGASAELRVADTENYVAEVTQTINGDNTTTSVDTDSVDSGFTLTIDSSWDKSTVYANVNVNLTNVDQIEDFTFSDGGAGGTDTIIQLPQTTERELKTQIRVRPGDSVLIAGLVRERDNFNSRGPGFMEPVIPDSRTAQTDNLELVILLRPRVIVYTGVGDERYTNYMTKRELSRQSALSPALVDMPSVESVLKTPVKPAPVAPPVPAPTPSPVIEPVATPLPPPVVPELVVEPVPAPIVTAPAPLPTPIIPAPVIEPIEVPVAEPVISRPIVPARVSREMRQPVVAPVMVAPPVVTAPVSTPIMPAPVADVSRSVPAESLYGSPSTEGVYVPRNSGYEPGYVARSYEGYISDDTAGAVVASEDYVFDQDVYATVPAPPPAISLDVPSSQPVPVNRDPLPMNVYENAQPINVYEAYERSLDTN